MPITNSIFGFGICFLTLHKNFDPSSALSIFCSLKVQIYSVLAYNSSGPSKLVVFKFIFFFHSSFLPKNLPSSARSIVSLPLNLTHKSN